MMSEEELQLQEMIDAMGIEVEETSVRTLSDYDLLTRYNSLTQSLLKEGEALDPHTQSGRDMHSEREAIKVEMIRRGIR